MNLLCSTVAFRPYVFIFLLVYLVAASFKLGFKKAILFTLSAWIIAYASEFSSVRTGIPFGLYHYIPCTTDCELWICGVPFMDSLSFTFLSYTSWTMARVLLSPSEGKGLSFRLIEAKSPYAPICQRGCGANPSPSRCIERFSPRIIILGAFLMMLLDVVIDPLSLRGDRWFLGKIYYYPEPGMYFGVTIANFIGWFIVGAVTMTLWGFMDRRVRDGWLAYAGPDWLDLWGPALYYIILLFNLFMTFYIGEYVLGLAGVLIFLPVTVLILFRIMRKQPSPQEPR